MPRPSPDALRGGLVAVLVVLLVPVSPGLAAVTALVAAALLLATRRWRRAFRADQDGVTRTGVLTGRRTVLAWDDLASVWVVPAASAGAWQPPDRWLLLATDDRRLVVPRDREPDGLGQLLAALPGFDDDALVRSRAAGAPQLAWQREDPP